MDTWLRNHLIATGAMTETGVSRKARPRRCPRCKELVVVGLDAEMCAFEVAADPDPLNTAGEVLALLEGRRTVALRQSAVGYRMDQRWERDIAAHPAGTKPREDVLRSHRCESPSPPESMTTTSSFARTTALPPGTPPPF